MSNPYTPHSPVDDARMFFGRLYELHEIGAFLNGNQSVSIVGPRKIGITSLMLHLMRAETMPVLGIGKENLFVYIDCQTLSGSRQEEIFTHFWNAITATLQTRNLEPETALNSEISPLTRSTFEVALRKLNQRGLRVVLMLDEFDHLRINPNVNVSFYNALRSAAGRLKLVYLTGSTQPLIELTYFNSSNKILSSPFFNIFAHVFLGLLTESEARNLIRTPMEAVGMKVSSLLEDFIYELVGGHPLGLQIACFYASESPEDLCKIELRTIQELEAYFQYYWHSLNPAERNVLRHLDKTGFYESRNPALAIVLRDLTKKCLLVKVGGSYVYPSRAWAEFVLTHKHDQSMNTSIEPPIAKRIDG